MFPHASMVARVTVVVDESENGTVMISVPLGRLNSSSDVGEDCVFVAVSQLS
jgi:hypothetical protein